MPPIKQDSEYMPDKGCVSGDDVSVSLFGCGFVGVRDCGDVW